MKFEKCKCGGTQFYKRYYIKGYGNVTFDTNGYEDSESLHDNLEYRETGKHHRCTLCGRIAKEIED